MRKMRCLWLALLAVALWLGGGVALAQGGGNAYLGQDVRIRSGEVIQGDVSILGGRAVLEEGSLVKGNVAVMAGEVVVNGHIEGDLVAFGGVVDLGARAVVEGDVVALGTVRRHPEAQIHGRLLMGLSAARSWQMFAWPPGELRSGAGPFLPEVGHWAGAAIRIVAVLLALVGIALVISALLPENLNRMAQVMVVSFPLSIAAGLLTFVLVIFLVPILVILCLGIPIAVALLLALAVGALVGWVAAGKLVGERLLQALHVGAAHPALAAGLGVGLMTLLAQVPCVGWLLGLFVLLWGLGAAVLSRLGFAATAFWPPPQGKAGPSPQGALSGAQPAGESRDTRPLSGAPPSQEG